MIDLHSHFCQQTVFVATEVAPWSKVDGLSDVMAALPQSLAARSAPTLLKHILYREADPLMPAEVYLLTLQCCLCGRLYAAVYMLQGPCCDDCHTLLSGLS